jgi:hypothetical protein
MVSLCDVDLLVLAPGLQSRQGGELRKSSRFLLPPYARKARQSEPFSHRQRIKYLQNNDSTHPAATIHLPFRARVYHPTALIISKMGRYMATIMPPTMPPGNTMGYMALRSPSNGRIELAV